MSALCVHCEQPEQRHAHGMCPIVAYGELQGWHPTNQFTPATTQPSKNLLCWDCAGERWKDASGGSQGPCQRCGKETYLRELLPAGDGVTDDTAAVQAGIGPRSDSLLQCIDEGGEHIQSMNDDLRDIEEIQAAQQSPASIQPASPPYCHGASDGECIWERCPQRRDGEPARSGRHCPLDDGREYEPAPEPQPAGGAGDSLIAAIEGNYAGMSHADLVLTCRMLERGRAAWRKEAEEAQARLSSPCCLFAGPGRGDCEHFVGLPGELVDGHNTDTYGKPNGWCWYCWWSYRTHEAEVKQPCPRCAELEAALGAVNRALKAHLDDADALLKQRDALKAKCASLERGFPSEQPLHDMPMDRQIVMLNRRAEELKAKVQELEKQLADKFPDIGQDPLKMEVHDGFEESFKRLTSGSDIQQKGVPDQTALVWRVDIERVRCEMIIQRGRGNAFTAAMRQVDDAKARIETLEKALREIVEITMPSKVGGAGPAYSIAMKCGSIANAALAGGKETL